MTKRELRKKYKALRNDLTYDEVDDLSIKIANNLLQLPIWNYNYYHTFLPIVEHKEVDTEFILNILNGKDKNIVLSKSNFETLSMNHFLLTDSTVIAKNEYHIPEPVDGIPISDELIEVVFVPLLAFDQKGQRVGYGKGFYDRFLSKCKPETLKVGLSFFEPEIEISDSDVNDIRLGYCVTPLRSYQFQ